MDTSNTYVGFGSKITIGADGIPRTEITIANKHYAGEKITELLDSIEQDIQDIQKKVDETKGDTEKEVANLIKVYSQTKNPVDKLKLLHQLVQIAADISTITVNVIDIKNKLGL